jgi:creatinine amidohydrolase
MKWAEQNRRQIADLPRDTICLLPLGAIEQHGPHLPVATDLMIAEAIATRIDIACGGKILVMPPLAVTCSEHHMAFDGTLTLQHETAMHVMTDILRSAVRHGFRRFCIVNAHGGNMAMGSVVAEQAAIEMPQADFVFSTWFRTASDRLREVVEGDYPAVGHACEFETSLMLVICPDLVDVDAIKDDGVTPHSRRFRSDMLSPGSVTRSIPFDRLTSSGVWGKPSLATAAKGCAILDIVVGSYKELFDAYWPDAPGVARHETVNDEYPISVESSHRRASV